MAYESIIKVLTELMPLMNRYSLLSIRFLYRYYGFPPKAFNGILRLDFFNTIGQEHAFSSECPKPFP